jgi:hypothetical protein
VVDPKEGWGSWFKRQNEGKDAPLVERESLPSNLQPQNRMLGTFHHYTHNLAATRKSQKTQLHPVEHKENMYLCYDLDLSLRNCTKKAQPRKTFMK